MKTLIRVLCVAAAGLTYGAAAHAQAASNAVSADAPVHIVTYYEVAPADEAPAQGARPRQIFSNYVDVAREEPGALAFDVLHDVEKHNRYVMLEVWRDNADFQQHMHAASSAQLAKSIQPWLIGPVDQRVHVQLQ